VITTAGRPESIAFCRDVLGADQVIDYASVDFRAAVRDSTAGRGVDVVLDSLGDETFRRSIDCLAPRGQLVTIVPSSPGEQAPTLLMRGITVHYEFMGVAVANEIDPGSQGAILSSIARLCDRGLLHVRVGKRLPLPEVAAAHRMIETGHTIGKIAVVVAGA
jgi:NADPH2:quinone reductase